jgi:ubiquinone/menaquinone biosynthesis C-methylase UbiE
VQPNRGPLPADYDAIAQRYDQRYRTNRFEGVQQTLADFIGADSTTRDILEIGCGTGHWLASLETSGIVAGVDPSGAMLKTARGNAPDALLVRGRAEDLAFSTASLDRVFCINALHHFQDARQFVREARRVLRPGGGLLTIGLDTHTGLDHWWIYDYFPDSLVADRKRYAPTSAIRALLTDAGFVRVSTSLAQHIPAERPFASVLEQGLLERHSTSQLLIIDDVHWKEGLAQLHAEQPVLRADLRLYATIGWVPEARPPR